MAFHRAPTPRFTIWPYHWSLTGKASSEGYVGLEPTGWSTWTAVVWLGRIWRPRWRKATEAEMREAEHPPHDRRQPHLVHALWPERRRRYDEEV